MQEVQIEKDLMTTPNYGLVPEYAVSRKLPINPAIVAGNRCVCINGDAPEIESYKVLRTRIQQRMRKNGWRTLMVTSPTRGCGKTVTAINLALTVAREFNQTVLLVDGDFKRQQVHRCLGIESDVGLINYLLEGVPLKDLIIWPGIDKFTVISGGRTIMDSTELLGSPGMGDIVSEMKSRYDDRLIIFDVPPILNVADTIAFAPLVDGILMVVENGRTAMRDVKKALTLIPRKKILGFVLNRDGSGTKAV